MNTSGEAADQVVRMMLEGTEYAVRLSGKGAVQLGALVYLEHHDMVKRMPPCAAFAFFFHALSQNGTETFKIDNFQPFQ